MPNTTGLYTLMSDTSIVATGRVLYQNQGITGRKHIIGFNSKKLPAAAKNYSITELELFGLVINIHAFKELLFGRYFECFCDHSALTYIFRARRRKPVDILIDWSMPSTNIIFPSITFQDRRCILLTFFLDLQVVI